MVNSSNPSRPSSRADGLITLAHGNGGKRTRALVDDVFARHLGEGLDTRVDAATLELSAGAWAVSVDGFTVDPLEFPGGDIGELAVYGTINDLAVSGAVPRHLTLSVLIEEGLELRALERIVRSLARAARESGVSVVAGDTKVVPRGHGGGLYLTTTGVGRVERRGLGGHAIAADDRLLVSGPVGDHGIAVMLAREQFDLRGDVRSDCASVLELARAAWALPGVRFLRDPTRGGLATVAHEIALLVGASVELFESRVPVRDPVRTVCAMLGYDPYYLACEGRIVAVAPEATTAALLEAWRALPAGKDAAEIGRVVTGPPRVVVRTTIGGARVLEELDDDPLPRIC